MWIPMGKPEAIARISGGKEAPCLFGTVKFYNMGKNVMVVVDISGLPDNDSGFYAFHIHDAEGHYDPGGKPHPLRAGDLPPLISCDGRAFFVVLSNRFALCQICGKTAVIHRKADDFTSQPSGNPGPMIGTGTIRQCL